MIDLRPPANKAAETRRFLNKYLPEGRALLIAPALEYVQASAESIALGKEWYAVELLLSRNPLTEDRESLSLRRESAYRAYRTAQARFHASRETFKTALESAQKYLKPPRQRLGKKSSGMA